MKVEGGPSLIESMGPKSTSPHSTYSASENMGPKNRGPKTRSPMKIELLHHRKDAPVTCAACGRRVARKARQQRYCSDRCRDYEKGQRRVRKRPCSLSARLRNERRRSKRES